jgi:glutaredoxin-related protein
MAGAVTDVKVLPDVKAQGRVRRLIHAQRVGALAMHEAAPPPCSHRSPHSFDAWLILSPLTGFLAAGGAALLGDMERALHSDGRGAARARKGAQGRRVSEGELQIRRLSGPAAPSRRSHAESMRPMQVEAEEVDDATAKFQVTSVPTFVFLKVEAACGGCQPAKCSLHAPLSPCTPCMFYQRLHGSLLAQDGAVVDRLEGADAPVLTQKTVALAGSAAAAPASTSADPAAISGGDVMGRIKYLLASHPVLLFMKVGGPGTAYSPRSAQHVTRSHTFARCCCFLLQGTAEAPRCGFSGRVVDALKDIKVREGTRGREEAGEVCRTLSSSSSHTFPLPPTAGAVPHSGHFDGRGHPTGGQGVQQLAHVPTALCQGRAGWRLRHNYGDEGAPLRRRRSVGRRQRAAHPPSILSSISQLTAGLWRAQAAHR